jgi:hypothetical protein
MHDNRFSFSWIHVKNNLEIFHVSLAIVMRLRDYSIFKYHSKNRAALFFYPLPQSENVIDVSEWVEKEGITGKE